MYEKHGETIDAREFLDALESDVTDITLTACTIEGVVDLFSSDIERDENDRIFLNKSLSCNGCTFTNVVNFRSVVFQKEVSFRRSIFEADIDLMKPHYNIHVNLERQPSMDVPTFMVLFSTKASVSGVRILTT